MRVYRVDGGHVVTKNAPENDASIFGLEVKDGNVISVLFNNQASPKSIETALEPWGFEVEQGSGESDVKYKNFTRAILSQAVENDMFFQEGLASPLVEEIPDAIKGEIRQIIKKGKTEKDVPENASTFEKMDEYISGRGLENKPNRKATAPTEPNQQTEDYLKYFKEYVAANDTALERVAHKVTEDKTPPWDRMNDDEIAKVDMKYVYINLNDDEAKVFRDQSQNRFFTIAQFNDLVEILDESWWAGMGVYYPGYNYPDGETININPITEEDEEPDQISYDDDIEQKDFDDIDAILSAFATQDMKRGFAQRMDLPSLNDELNNRLIEICQKYQLSYEDDFDFELDYHKVSPVKFKKMVEESIASEKPLDFRNKDLSGFSIRSVLTELAHSDVNIGLLKLDQAFLSYSRMQSKDFQFLNDVLVTLDQSEIKAAEVDMVKPKKTKEPSAQGNLESESGDLLKLFEQAHSR